jgi:dTDP-4-dehydrorhamnose 3,5-epimerase
MNLFDGVELISLVTHADERGFFREVLRNNQCEFGQWSHSMMVTSTIKAWHIHRMQTDWFYCPIGIIRVALCDLRNEHGSITLPSSKIDLSKEKYEVQEYLLGDNQPPSVLVIPPGVAHGLKVLQGPAHLFYVTSKIYNPQDEGRIAYDSLGYDWHRVDIK